MFFTRLVRPRFVLIAALCIVAERPGIFAQAAPTAPTATEDPATIDGTWQKASAKYDYSAAGAAGGCRRVRTAKGRFGRIGSRCRNTKFPSGTRTRSSESSFTGACIRCRRLEASGIRARCITKGSEEYKHHIATYGPQDKFGYKDFIPHVQGGEVRSGGVGAPVQRIGREICGAGVRSITMVLRCMTAASPIGRRRRWGRIAMYGAIWRRRYGRRVCILAHRRIAWSTTSFWE